jgi:hypothetical protein
MSAAPFYAELASGLSQGDLVDNVPWGLVEAPVTLCRPDNRKSATGKAFYGSAAELKRPAPWSHDPEFVHGVAWSGLVMVLWHGCQIDKSLNQGGATRAAKAFAAIAPVIELDRFQPAERRIEVRNAQHFSYFPIPALDGSSRPVAESYVDLRHIWSVRQSILIERVTSVSDGARLSLYEHLFTFFTRLRLDVEATCPTCGTSVALHSVAEGGE